MKEFNAQTQVEIAYNKFLDDQWYSLVLNGLK